MTTRYREQCPTRPANANLIVNDYLTVENVRETKHASFAIDYSLSRRIGGPVCNFADAVLTPAHHRLFSSFHQVSVKCVLFKINQNYLA